MESNAGPFDRLTSELSLLQPMVPTYLHVLFSALFSIYIGTHASLSIPSTAEKPNKPGDQTLTGDEDDEEEDGEEDESRQQMEGLSPVDAIMFPLLAGCTLAGLYFLIKWLEDPALLNKLLNWYFSVFGVLSVARLLTDSMAVVTSYVFPATYTSGGEAWKINRRRRQAESNSRSTAKRNTPLPGVLSKLKLSPNTIDTLWTLRELPARQLHVRTYVHKLAEARFRIGPQGFSGLILAIVAVLYFNLVDKPWWLTNLLGLSFSYSALQLMSPTTFWTGTMILSTLFVYDIYFVFFTPLMVTVAKKLDIPIKLLFPRPPGPGDDPSKQSLAMLGLGDIVLPGIMIGLALRFDLYLFYLRKQARRDSSEGELRENHDQSSELVRAKWRPATGGWGERFWAWGGVSGIDADMHGGNFPKTYFYASIFGYVLGMVTTLGIMQVYSHAQPALLYLVPGVLSTLWGTAFLKGDTTLMWEYNESEESHPEDKKSKDLKGVESIFSPSRQEGIAKRLEEKVKEGIEVVNAAKSQGQDDQISAKIGKPAANTRKDLVLFSISFPDPPRHDKTSPQEASPIKTRGATRPSLEDELRMASQDDLGSQNASLDSVHRRRSATDEQAEPTGKRQRRE
ncbi:hypothetical protein MMC07_003794 [Pseudocyphellaria aurata]|nr:hypothetical protein [Pseudocyphellaria aurata]